MTSNYAYIEQTVTRFVRQVLRLRTKPARDLDLVDDLGLGSLDSIDLQLQLEQRFELPCIPDHEFVAARTIRDLSRLVLRLMEDQPHTA